MSNQIKIELTERQLILIQQQISAMHKWAVYESGDRRNIQAVDGLMAKVAKALEKVGK